MFKKSPMSLVMPLGWNWGAGLVCWSVLRNILEIPSVIEVQGGGGDLLQGVAHLEAATRTDVQRTLWTGGHREDQRGSLTTLVSTL